MDKKKKKSFFSNMISLLFRGSNHTQTSILEEEMVQSPFRTIMKTFFSNKVAMTGLITFSIIFILVFTLSAVYPLDLTYQDVTQQNVAPGLNFLKYPSELDGSATSIAAGSTFGVGVDEKGNAYVWGKPDNKLKRVLENNPISKTKLSSVSAGLDHILAIDKTGKVVTWSANRFKLNQIPEDLRGANNVKQVATGYQISGAVTDDGILHIWGNVNFMGDFSQETIPEDVQGNVDKFVFLGNSNVFVLLKDKTVRVLGASGPAASYLPEMENVIDIASTDDTLAAVTADGSLYVWGNSRYGQIELPADIGKNVKNANSENDNVYSVAEGTSVKAIVGARNHYMAVDKENRVYAWGRNTFNQTEVPEKYTKANDSFKTFYTGGFSSYIVDKDGKIDAFGNKGYLLGTDHYGRDVFFRLINGGRMTLTVGAVAVIIASVIGIIIGGISGYYSGTVDIILMRFAEITGSIPFLPIAMTLSVIVGNKVDKTQRILMIMVILGILSWSGLAKLVRAQILSVRSSEFVLAAKATGIREGKIIFRHIIPNVISVITVYITLSYAGSMLTESTLSFLGFGITEPDATWGNMLTASQSSTTVLDYWWRWVFPAGMLSICTISINLIGDGLQAAIDPKSKDR